MPTPVLTPPDHLSLLNYNCFSSLLVPGWLESSVGGLSGATVRGPWVPEGLIHLHCSKGCWNAEGTWPKSGDSGAHGESAAGLQVLSAGHVGVRGCRLSPESTFFLLQILCLGLHPGCAVASFPGALKNQTNQEFHESSHPFPGSHLHKVLESLPSEQLVPIFWSQNLV